MFSIEILLSDRSLDRSEMDRMGLAIHKFLMNSCTDLLHTKDVFVIFPEEYMAKQYFDSRESYAKDEKLPNKRVLVRVSGKLVSKDIIRGESEPSFPSCFKREEFEKHIKELLTKRDMREGVYFQYM